MKYLSLVIAAFLLISISGCAGGGFVPSKQGGIPPTFRVQNTCNSDASLQVKTSGGNTININNVAPGTISAYQNVEPGIVEVTVVLQGQTNNPYTGTFVAVNNQTFTVVLKPTTPPSITVVSP